MRIIGITGGIGSGKSEIMKHIASHYDATTVQADMVGHILMRPGQPCYQPVISLLGDDIVKADGELDRSTMAARVYADQVLLSRLNRIIHPAVKEYIKKSIRREQSYGTEYFFIEAALLLEDRYDQLCDEIWYIYADEEVRRERLKASRGYTDYKIDKILASQLSEEEFAKRCQFKINNSNQLENAIIQIDLRMQSYENV